MYCEHPKYVYNKYLNRDVLVPCGKCDSCRITRANSLSIRVANECKNHPYNLFATLTYDTPNVPVVDKSCQRIYTLNGRLDVPFSELSEKQQISMNEFRSKWSEIHRPLTNYPKKDCFGILYKKDIQDFIKRLRSAIDYEIEKSNRAILLPYKIFSFFAAAEYGTEYKRPHFHVVLHFDNWEVAEFARVHIPKIWPWCDWLQMRKLELADGKERLPSYIKSAAAANYVSSYLAVSNSVANVVEKSNFKPFVTFSKRPLYGCTKIDKEILHEFINGKTDAPVNKEVLRSGKNGLSTAVHVFSANFLRSLFPRFAGIDELSDSDMLRLCVNDSPIKQRHNLYTKCRSFCLKYFGCHDAVSCARYLEIYRRMTSRVKSYLLQTFMETYDKYHPLEYIKSCYHTFEEYRDKVPIYIYKTIYENFGIDISRNKLMLYDFGYAYANQLSYRKQEYYKKLLPKHFSNKLLNYCPYG